MIAFPNKMIYQLSVWMVPEHALLKIVAALEGMSTCLKHSGIHNIPNRR
jgi:hypothetical protein